MLRRYNNFKIGKVLINKHQIRVAIKKLAKKINNIYDGTPILLVSILKGSFVFLADLLREIKVPCQVAFMSAKSYYNSTTSSGEVKIELDIDCDIKNKKVVIVEDIVDTGRTLKEVCNILQKREPKELQVVALLDKPSGRAVNFTPNEVLFTIPNVFVIGYGLDCAEEYRNLPFIAEYKE